MIQIITFNDPLLNNLDPAWTWQDYQADAIVIDDKGLSIRVLPGTFWEQINNGKNVLLRNKPDTDNFRLELTVTFKPEINGEQAGLVLYVDDDNYVKVVSEWVDGHCAVMVREEAAKAGLIEKQPVTSTDVDLAIVVKNGTAEGYYRMTGDEDWKPCGSCPLPSGSPMKVGLFTSGVRADVDNRAMFRDFKILS